MCYDNDAVPPAPAEPTTTAASERLLLVSADGAACAAYLSLPAQPSGPGVLVLPDNRGLSAFYEQLAVRLAEQGLPAIAVDYFGRTAGPDHQARPADFGALPGHMRHLRALTRDGLYADFDAALACLREQRGVGAVISLGFCMGGRFAFQTAHRRFALAGAIGLYGFPDALHGAPGPIQLAPELTAPVLGMFAGDDEGIPAPVVAAFDAALAAAGNDREITTYPGTPHGFFEAGGGGYEAECADVWRRVLAFARARGRQATQ
jgi:carboxymethylenebutenolidase